MDDYRNQNENSDEQANQPTQPSDSFYSAHKDNPDTQHPSDFQPNGSQQWQSGQQGSGQQSNGPYWQNGQPNNQQNNQSYWQNGQQASPQYWQNGQPYGQPPRRRNNLALASMIFGIFSLLTSCIPFIQFPLAVVSIVLVILSKKKQPLDGFAIAGLVMGIISVVISILMTIYWGYFFTLMNDPEWIDMYNEIMQRYS